MLKLSVITQDNETYVTEVENYDSEKINETINDPDRITIVIGDLILSRIDIKRIIPLDESQISE
ncbi:hypothetical protein [Alkalihalobacillus pseudalcaliphilus]|uniref:hypothetical protein n=1 Tax=Alkalihalobacillus pseudalcaliphilus TaxID=79884 RepID=UPI00069D29BA|nr:hypothetical protein [Alkalihalobacillus pseudalcaliphilus]